MLTAGRWNAELVDELEELMRDDDVRFENVRVVSNARQCRGFSTTTGKFAAASPVHG